ncbi:MAG: hypothetical protein M3Y54_14390, partial [Bacteroidota bacterium]|nr:hypothetical protein [Bacteroidota bacterium]
QLFPDKSTMLAMMYLLNKFADADGPECEFSEQQLFVILQQASEDAPALNSSQRTYTPREHLNNKVHRLLEHYLSRDERTGMYSFTQYAISLYHNVHKTLFEKVNPVKVAGIFRTLLTDLATNSLQHWASVTLPSLQNDVYQQLLAFDNDINATLKRLRRHMHQDEQDFLAMLGQVSGTLEELRDQAQALTEAFSISEAIQSQIGVQRLAQDEDTEDEAIPQAVAFLRRARGKLGAASDRLERVRPRINTLFSDLAKLRFDRNTERFLDFLLAAEPEAGKAVALPAGIAVPYLWGPAFKFRAVPRSTRLFPLARVKTRGLTEDPAVRLVHEQAVRQKIQQTTRVQDYLRQITQALQTDSELLFTPYAARILAAEGAAAYGILLQVIDRLLREVVPSQRWEVIVTPQPTRIQNQSIQITLWDIYLRNPARR